MSKDGSDSSACGRQAYFLSFQSQSIQTFVEGAFLASEDPGYR